MAATTSGSTPSSSPAADVIPAIVSASRYSRIEGARPDGDDARHHRGDGVEVGERDEERSSSATGGGEAQRHLGHQGERALGADDQLGEVVARRRLHDLPPGAHDGAVGEDDLEAEDVVAGDAVAHRAHPAGVGVDVAAERPGELAGVDGVAQPGAGEGGVELAQRHAGLDDGDLVVDVDVEHSVHPVEGDDEPALDRRRPRPRARFPSRARRRRAPRGRRTARPARPRRSTPGARRPMGAPRGVERLVVAGRRG